MEDTSGNESKNLDGLKSFIEDMNASNSTLDKAAKLKKYSDNEYVKKALLYTYDPYRKYFVTVDNLLKNDALLSPKERATSLFELLDDLDSRKYTGHAAIGRVNTFVAENFMYAKEIHAVIDRNLKIRLDTNEINKVFPELIPSFDVALAKTFDNSMMEADKRGKTKVDFVRDAWYASRKLDGCRCACVIDETGDVSFRSRAGNEFLTLGVLRREIGKWGLKSVVFDGEICLMDKAGNEDFRGVMSQINRKDHTIANPKYNIFDMLTLEEFRAKSGKLNFSLRNEVLNDIVKTALAQYGDTGNIKVLAQGRVKDAAHLKSLIEIASKNGWEGVMLRKDVPYEGKRTTNLLKVKQMQDAEYEVAGLEISDITSTFYRDGISKREVEWSYDDDGYMYVDTGDRVPSDDIVESYSDTRNMVGKIIIVHRGNHVGVGSGLSMAQRRAWHDNPDLIIGKTATIQYFQETEVDGVFSLRFPVLKHVHGDKREV